MKKFNKQILIGLLAALCTLSPLAGCKNSSAVSNPAAQTAASDSTGTSGSSKYKDTIQIDVFDTQANYQGVQSGWFGKIVKDKFNMRLNIIAPNVAGGGDNLFNTRSAAGNLGDIIMTGSENGRLLNTAKAGLLLDLTDKIKTTKIYLLIRKRLKWSRALFQMERFMQFQAKFPSKVLPLRLTVMIRLMDRTSAGTATPPSGARKSTRWMTC